MILRDDDARITAQLNTWIADPGIDVVISSGGTGLTGRDVTVEAFRNVFEKEIDGIKINGVDIITFDDEGRITHFKVMVRPLKAMNMLHALMGAELARP